MINRVKVLLLLISGFVGVYGMSAYAHVLQIDGSIGAVLHINPDDDPIAHQETSFFLDFQDTEKKFSLSVCDCRVFITAQGTEVFSQSLPYPSFSFTFPQRNMYTLRVEGVPNDTGVFQPFTLTYDIRVEKDSGATTGMTKPSLLPPWIKIHFVHIVATVVLVIATIVIGVRIK